MTISGLMGRLVQMLSDYCNKEIVVIVEDNNQTAYKISDLKNSGKYITMTIEES